MSRLDNTPQPVREAIAAALMIGAVTATAATLLQQPLFLFGGLVLFAIFYVWRINPQVRQAYQEQIEYDARYADDKTYEPLLERFAQDENDDALIDGYRTWKSGPHANDTRLRFLQEAILAMIAAGKIYRIEELMGDVEQLAAQEGLTERFESFRAECDRRIAEIAQQRLGEADAAENMAKDSEPF